MTTENSNIRSTAAACPLFSILIPTFNRGHLLARALESAERQTFRDFEVVIIDDGSTDGTRDLVQKWQQRAPFPIVYHWQENQGKHGAHNTALAFLRGFFTVILDSDDVLVPNALERLKFHWDSIPADRKSKFSGVEGLVCYFDGAIEGTRFPLDVLDADYLSLRKRYRVGGDKRGCVRSDILREFPFPRFAGERHVRPSLLWKRVAQKYQTRFVNEVVQLVERQPGGLSSDRFRLRTRNPAGFRFYFMEDVNLHGKDDPLGQRLQSCANFVRYSFHSGSSLAQQFHDIRYPALWLLSLPRGMLAWIRDRIRMRAQRIS